MSLTSGNQNCSRYCWGSLHFHSPSEYLSNDLWMIGKVMTRIPSIFEEAAAYQDPHAPVQPISERVVDNIFLGLMAVTTLGAAPIIMVGAGIAKIGERFLGTVDVIHQVAEKTHTLGELLKEEQKLIENFGPLLELADKIPLLAPEAEKKAKAYEESTRSLAELQNNYASNPGLFEKLRLTIIRLNDFLTKSLQEKTSTGAGELLIKRRLEMVQRISEKERRIKELHARVQDLMSTVEEQDHQLQSLTPQVTALTQQKDRLIEAVRGCINARNSSGNKSKKEASDGRLVEV